MPWRNCFCEVLLALTYAPIPVLLSGNMCDARMWDVLRAEMPGLAEAVCADLSRDDSIEAMARRVLAAVDGRLLPIGFSMGGIVALTMVAIAPERLAGLVLLDTNASADLPERAAHRPAQQAEVRTGGLERVVVQELKPKYLAAAHRSNASLLGVLRDMAIDLGPEVFIRQSEALRRRPDQRPTLAAFEGPIFLACGSEDRLCPPAGHQANANAARDAVFHEIGGAGHMLPMEQPQRLAALLAPWIEQRISHQ